MSGSPRRDATGQGRPAAEYCPAQPMAPRRLLLDLLGPDRDESDQGLVGGGLNLDQPHGHGFLGAPESAGVELLAPGIAEAPQRESSGFAGGEGVEVRDEAAVDPEVELAVGVGRGVDQLDVGTLAEHLDVDGFGDVEVFGIGTCGLGGVVEPPGAADGEEEDPGGDGSCSHWVLHDISLSAVRGDRMGGPVPETGRRGV